MITKSPLYLKFSLSCLGMVAFFYILYVGAEVLKPLVFAGFIAILLNPIVKRLVKRGMSPILAMIISMLVSFGLLVALIYFISAQVATFSDELPDVEKNLGAFAQQTLHWFTQSFGISQQKITTLIADMKAHSDTKYLVSQMLGLVSDVVRVMVLLPVYIFLMLYYKPLFLNFIAMLFPQASHGTVKEVLRKSAGMIQNYLVGLLIEFAIVAVLTSVALLIIGIPSAVLFGVLTALLNLVPYIGIVIALMMPVLMAIAIGNDMAAVWTVVAFVIIQLLDNNVIVPRVVASKVRINALISIVVVIVGGMLWNIAGMFISLPLIAIVKVVFDNIPSLEPYGYVLGGEMPHLSTTMSSIFEGKDKKEE